MQQAGSSAEGQQEHTSTISSSLRQLRVRTPAGACAVVQGGEELSRQRAPRPLCLRQGLPLKSSWEQRLPPWGTARPWPGGAELGSDPLTEQRLQLSTGALQACSCCSWHFVSYTHQQGAQKGKQSTAMLNLPEGLSRVLSSEVCDGSSVLRLANAVEFLSLLGSINHSSFQHSCFQVCLQQGAKFCSAADLQGTKGWQSW